MDMNEYKKQELILSLYDEEDIFYYPSVVFSFYVLQFLENSFCTYLIIKENVEANYRLKLFGLINIHLGNKICLNCGEEILENSTERECRQCITLTERQYKSCLFYSPYTIHNKKCEEENVLCNNKENISRCFSPFYLYFGRFGEIMKVGISRLSYGQYKYSRLLQQGLNEAYVVYPFHSLSDVTFYERLLIDEIGINERITFDEKVESLLESSLIKIEDFYPISQIKELFPDKKIKQVCFYRDNPLSDILYSVNGIEKKQIVNNLTGNIIYTQGNVGLLKNLGNLTFFDISKLVGKTIRREVEW